MNDMTEVFVGESKLEQGDPQREQHRTGMGFGGIVARLVLAGVGLASGAFLGLVVALMSGWIDFGC